ncbi:hypothetical protein H6G33_15245 [Calothrix sp. FACHB-1219]|uniref:hypothetical protein n=1 Tax=unclassified Calothrix TaxID=2619626 RepID=UPI0016881416|nr:MULTISPECIES: hypothetical protein [unclassified Calothrix]MBD2204296.1 hypothetical protein [Calothrix sp. FACHB-168]MBD2218391.1 hypothetical protein [Calothrix sp. FACHB-1219]
MGKQRSVEPQERLETFLEHLAAARDLQRNWMTYGLDYVDRYVEDVDGDWWEKWEEEEQQSFLDSVIDFLKSDDSIALIVRQQLGNKPIPEIAEKLEKYFSFPEAERMFAFRNFLTNSFIEENNGHTPNNFTELELCELITKLLNKLQEISLKYQSQFL